jgi:hypothetical protein
VLDLPGYVWALTIAGCVGIPLLTALALYRGGLAAVGRRTATGVAVVFGTVWVGWVLVSGVLAGADTYRQSPRVPNPWLAVAAVGTLVAALLATRIPVVARILADPGTAARLAVPQTLRAIGGVFLAVLALGQLPAVFALPAGLGDIAVGVAAPFVAYRLSRGTGRTAGVWFNALGIVDLVVAVSIGALAGLGPVHVIDSTPSTLEITLLPLALIPTTAVPLAVALHIVSLRRLRRPVAVAEPVTV